MERKEDDKSKINTEKSTAASWGYSRPKASIKITEVTHFFNQGKIWSKGKYKVIEIFTDDRIHFEGYWRVE